MEQFRRVITCKIGNSYLVSIASIFILNKVLWHFSDFQLDGWVAFGACILTGVYFGLSTHFLIWFLFEGQ